ncbi:dihydrofolate reductase-like domain-containing protein [Hypoxylon sp. FL1284]|nr:dihydrofolate reductase-like domain-containing protein [Hypoxylon sp. FL1284]
MASPPAPLTREQKDFFLEHGYLKLTNCFTREQAAEVTEGVWTRLGMSPTDQSTWTKERTNMPSHRSFDSATFAPRAWAAICELCGGEERVAPESRQWRDSLIVNLGTAAGAGHPVPPRELANWHVDGDFFVHYLDSPEQALLVIPLFTDIAPEGGGTMLCPPAIATVARHLAAHPEGVSPRMVPRAHPDFPRERNLAWYAAIARACPDAGFVEAVGDVGDVYLLHPLMMHSATSNARRNVRIITNPPVAVREPFRFDRRGDEDGEHSLVELKTMAAAGGADSLRGWAITHPRERLVPERVRIQEAMKREEMRRLEEERGQAQQMSDDSPSAEMLPPELTLIVAATRSMGIGRAGTLPWTGLKKEMAYFARVTKRVPPSSPAAPNAVIMGRKTWDSIPLRFRPLKGRLNIVVSRTLGGADPRPGPEEEGPVTVASLDHALAYLEDKPRRRAFVIGGAQIYDAALRRPEARRVLLTRVASDFECDTFFPLALDDGSSTGWVRRSKEELDAWTGETVPEGVQEENGTRYEFQMWERVD